MEKNKACWLMLTFYFHPGNRKVLKKNEDMAGAVCLSGLACLTGEILKFLVGLVRESRNYLLNFELFSGSIVFSSRHYTYRIYAKFWNLNSRNELLKVTASTCFLKEKKIAFICNWNFTQIRKKNEIPVNLLTDKPYKIQISNIMIFFK